MSDPYATVFDDEASPHPQKPESSTSQPTTDSDGYQLQIEPLQRDDTDADTADIDVDASTQNVEATLNLNEVEEVYDDDAEGMSYREKLCEYFYRLYNTGQLV